MNALRRTPPGTLRASTGTLAWLAALALASGGAGCTALIDQELSSKTGGSDGGGGTGGAFWLMGGAGGTSASTSATTSSTTTTQTPTGPCPGGCILDHATAVCAMGGCAIADCDAGFADCDQAPWDGCEADLLHDDHHCGKCDRQCQADEGETCKEGKCK